MVTRPEDPSRETGANPAGMQFRGHPSGTRRPPWLRVPLHLGQMRMLALEYRESEQLDRLEFWLEEVPKSATSGSRLPGIPQTSAH